MYAPRAETSLGNFKTTSLTQQDVAHWNTNVGEYDFGLAEGRVGITERVAVGDDFDAGRVLRHKYHRLLGVTIRIIRVRLAHKNQQFAALTHGACRKPLATIDHVIVAVPND